MKLPVCDFAPKMRPVPDKRATMVAALDIGTSKIACLIGRLRPRATPDTLRGRSHAIDVLGLSHVEAHGIKAGAVVDLAAAEHAVRRAVALAERMAGVRVEAVVLSISAGRIGSRLIEAAAQGRGGAVARSDIERLIDIGTSHATPRGRSVLHAVPVGYTIDGVAGVRDPVGMLARDYAIQLNVATTDTAAVNNLMLVVERCHLEIEAVASGAYVAGLAVLTDDEADLGAAIVDLGAGTTSIATFTGGGFTHASAFALGGHHLTLDLARHLSTAIADAERIKTLYGNVLISGSDSRDLVSVPAAVDFDFDPPKIVSRATIASVLKPRVEEIFEMVRDRLQDSPFAAETRGRVVLTGGAALMTGVPELAQRVLGRPVRLGRPLGLSRLPDAAKSAAFAVPAGLLVYPQFAHLECSEPRNGRHLAAGTDSYIGKVGQWLREGF